MAPRSDPQELPRVAIVGRPNVGKSTLFNRIVGRRQAIVGSMPGLTRDRHAAEADWDGRRFVVVDTGGMEWGPEGELVERVRQHALEAVEHADLILLMVDGRDGLMTVEEEIAQLLRRRDVELIGVVNKCDTQQMAEAAKAEFFRLGIDPLVAVSAEHGRGIGELLDAVVERLPTVEGIAMTEDDGVAIAVVGRPNVGKSSLVNALLGAERVVVSEQPGTTRDAIDSVLERDGRRYRVIDTAGIRKRGKVDTHAEIASVAVARRRLERADVALLLIEPYDGVTRQDLHIAQEADAAGAGLVIVVNKWDTVEPEEGLTLRFRNYVRHRLGRMAYAPVAFTSATERRGVEQLLPLVDRVQASRAQRVPTARLNAMFDELMARGGEGTQGSLRPRYLTQVETSPPTFVVFASGRTGDPEGYRRYLENRLREAFDFTGTPLVIRLRHRGRGRRRGRRRG